MNCSRKPLRNTLSAIVLVTLAPMLIAPLPIAADEPELRVVRYNNPGLVVDLGVGLWAWPMPMDYDQDGDMDLVVSCPDKPYNGTYLFENPGGDVHDPVFKPAVRLGKGYHNIQVSFVNNQPRVLIPGTELTDFRKQQFSRPQKLGPATNIHQPGRKIRANQWKYVDFDGDGLQDLSVAVGDWQDYGWDDAYNSEGAWTNGPLKGFVYILRNTGSNASPEYAKPRLLDAGDGTLQTFGWPSPSYADMDGDGDLDIVCGEFLDRFTYFENTGTRTTPRYAAGRRLQTADGELQMDLQMIVPALVDWDGDGDQDIVCGDEDGRVALIVNTGRWLRESVSGTEHQTPLFEAPRYFRQEAVDLKCGALATPFGCDWDADGDEDIVCGNTAGYIGLFENLGGGEFPKWAPLRYLEVDGEPIRIQAGPNGSIQGPCEAKWGYTTLNVADWDHDGRPDIVVNSIWGAIDWYRNTGEPGHPKLEPPRHVRIDWKGEPRKPEWMWWTPEEHQFVTQWRTTPVVTDWNQDGLNDLVMLDHEGYLAWFERERAADGSLTLTAGQRVFVDEQNRPIRLNSKRAGGSGRRKLELVDWDGDGRLDLLANSTNADLYHNVGQQGVRAVLKNLGPIDSRNVAGHTSSPTTVDWNADGIPDLLVGAEDGRLYLRMNPRTKR